MQKLINGIAVLSGVVSLTVVGVAGYVFIRKDAIIESVKSKVMESVLPTVPSLPSLGSAGSAGAQSILPDLPTPMPF